MLKRIGVEAWACKRPAELTRSEKLVLPGVGAFDQGMRNLHASGMVPALEHEVLVRKKPILGICLGMQMMSERSEEGCESGLGWFQAETVRLRFDDHAVKVPHMRWNEVRAARTHPLTTGLNRSSRFYFVHSYHVVPREHQDILLWTTYGRRDIAAAIVAGNVFGVQFHPEKSHNHGKALLTAYVRLSP